MTQLFKIVFSLIMIMMLIACDTHTQTIDNIYLEIDLETYAITYDEESIEVLTAIEDDQILITIKVKDANRFLTTTALWINDVKLDSDPTYFDYLEIRYVILKTHLIDPNAYKAVQVTFDLNTGLWPKEVFETRDAYLTLSLGRTQDTLSPNLSLFDHTTTQLRWHDKLFIKYHETMDAYQVVSKDLATASVENLGLSAFDYVLALPTNTTDLETQTQFRALINQITSSWFVLFNIEDLEDTTQALEVRFYDETSVSGMYQQTYLQSVKLPEPVKDEFVFAGWSDGTNIFFDFPMYQHKDQIDHITYTAIWEGASLTELNLMLQEVIPTTTFSHLSLPTSYSGFEIVWSSSQEEVISSNGTFHKPYVGLVVTLTATITSDQHHFTKGFDIVVQGYKALDQGIASSYIYRNYDLVDDAYFQTIDIINLAFVTANSNADLIGTHTIANYETYIKPKAQLHGNWVVMSIAPESSWSTIAASATLIEKFAHNIVVMINDNGFDGVDIDWETPTAQEAPRFTDLMRVVYQKVKDNNPNHLVTTAITGGMWQPPRYDLLNSLQYLDYINMMTYGMTSSGGQYHNALYPISSFHNTTLSAGRTLVSCSIEESIAIFNQQFNVPNSKIIVGAAFYGIRQVRTYNASTQSWSTWQNAGSVHYTQIANEYLNHPNYTEYYDTRAGVPYMLKNDGTEFISYDNPRSIREKSAYVLAQGLAGIMYWEHGTDATGLLIQALRVGMQK